MYTEDEPRFGPRGGKLKPHENDGVSLTLTGGSNHVKVKNAQIQADSKGNVIVFVGKGVKVIRVGR
jgi:hypothetical protein